MSRTMKLDFTGVESFLRASEGEHIVKIAAADVKQSQGGNDMIVVQYEVIKGNDKGARVFENYPLVETALWKLKGLLQAIGMKADGKVQIDLDRMIGKTCIINVFHEEYEGKTRAKVESVKRFAADVEEDAEDVEDEEEEQPKKSEKTKPSKKPAMNPPADEDEDDDWDDDEEEEEKPAPKKKPEKSAKPEKPAKKAPKKSDEDDDDWDDDDWDE